MTFLGLVVVFCAFLVLCAGAKFEFDLNSPFFLFEIALLFLFIFPSVQGLMFSGAFPNWVYLEAAFFAFLYSTCFVVLRFIFVGLLKTRGVWGGVVFRSVDGVGHSCVAPGLLLVSALLFVFGLGITSISAAFELNWWDLVRSGSPLVLAATYFAYASSSMILLLPTLRWSKVLYCCSVVLTVLFLLFSIFILKTRSYVLMFLVPYFLATLYSRGWRNKIGILLLAFAIVFLFVLTRAVRHAEDLSQFLEYGLLYFIFDAAEGSETSFVDAFFFFVERGGSFPDFGENFTLWRILFFWMPSNELFVKPVDFSYVMHSAYFGSSVDEGLSMHPTVFGDAYGNAGFAGAFLYSGFLALYFSLLEGFVKLLGSRLIEIAAFSVFAVCSLTLARGAVYNGFMFSLLPLLLFCGAVWCFGFFGGIRWK